MTKTVGRGDAASNSMLADLRAARAVRRATKRAEQHGRQGFELGFAASDNPHTAGTPEAAAWERGWEDQRNCSDEAMLQRRVRAIERNEQDALPPHSPWAKGDA